MDLTEKKPQMDEDIEELIDATEEDGVVLAIEADSGMDESGRQTIYATHLYDHHEDDKGVYYMFVPDNVFTRRQRFSTKQALHDFLLDQYEAENVEIPEIEDDDIKSRFKKWELRDNPYHHVKVFVKSKPNDGRYKDEFKYYRGPDEETIREENGLTKPENKLEEDSKYVYFYLGTIGDVLEDFDPSEHDFQFKKSGGRSVDIDILALNLDSEVKETLRCEDE